MRFWHREDLTGRSKTGAGKSQEIQSLEPEQNNREREPHSDPRTASRRSHIAFSPDLLSSDRCAPCSLSLSFTSPLRFRCVCVCGPVRASGTPINLGEKIVWNLEIWNSIKPNSLRQINLVAKIKNQINYLRTVRTVPFPRTSIGE